MPLDTSSFQIGPYEIDPASNRVRGPDREIALEPKVMAVLALLASRRGAVVTRTELVDEVWAREYGGDESLTRAISLLRKALRTGLEGGSVRWIETIPKRGYRLLEAETPTAPERTGSVPASRGRSRLFLGLGLVLAIGIAALLVLRDESTPLDADPDSRPVLAVLPFDYHGSETGDAHLADGLADEVLSALARSPLLSVIAGTSSFRFREERKNLELLRRELSITHLVDGTVRRSPAGLRVGVHLVDAASGLVLWSDVLERSENAFYSIPADVSAAILAALGGAPKERGVVRQPEPQAYQAYLQARALMRNGTPANLAQALTLLETAVERDPALAEAWGQLAMARLNVLITMDTAEVIDPPQRRQAIRRAAEQALALDPDSVNGRLALTTIDYRERHSTLQAAEAEYRALVSLAPRNPEVNVRMGMMFSELGRLEEAYDRFRAAYDLDRYSSLTAGMYANSHYMTGRREAGHALIRDQQRASALPILLFQQFVVLVLEQRFDDARSWLDRFKVLPVAPRWVEQPDVPARTVAALERLIAEVEQAGRISDSTVSELLAVTNAGALVPAMTIQLFGAGGREDEAYAMIEQALAEGDRFMRVATFDPAISGLRAQPRVMRLYAASGQLHYWLTTGNWPDFCGDPELPYDCRTVGEELAALGLVREG